MEFRTIKNVTLPLFKISEVPLYVRSEAHIYLGKEIEGKTLKDSKEPPHLMKVTNLETGELGEMILGSVLVKELEGCYPNDGYIGKSFSLVKTGVKEGTGGKRYNLYGITEVEVVADKVKSEG